MVSSFKEKIKTSDLKKLKTSVCFCINLPPRSHIDLSHFRKINWAPPSKRVKYCIPNAIFKCWNGVVPGYIYETFTPSLWG